MSEDDDQQPENAFAEEDFASMLEESLEARTFEEGQTIDLL